MKPERTMHHWSEQLPHTEGALEVNAPLSKLSWFRVGGPAEVLFRPRNTEDLARLMKALPEDMAVTVIGVGSNLLIRDGGVDGLVIRLGKPFALITTEGVRITAGAGAMDVTVAYMAEDHGIGGLEFLRGIPGTVGGAVAMNAGAYGDEVRDILVSFTAVDRRGNIHKVSAKDIKFSYRHTNIPSDWIITEAVFEGRAKDSADIQQRMDKICAERETSQPLRTRTGGSTFKNPAGEKKAWQLVDEAGCRGLRHGGAVVSDKHTNFLINTGNATAADIEELGEIVRQKVHEKTGVNLEWEIRRIGKRADTQ